MAVWLGLIRRKLANGASWATMCMRDGIVLQIGKQLGSGTSLVPLGAPMWLQGLGLAVSGKDKQPSQLALWWSVAPFTDERLRSLAVLQALHAARAQRTRVAI
jgi:hypothetical protein